MLSCSRRPPATRWKRVDGTGPRATMWERALSKSRLEAGRRRAGGRGGEAVEELHRILPFSTLGGGILSPAFAVGTGSASVSSCAEHQKKGRKREALPSHVQLFPSPTFLLYRDSVRLRKVTSPLDQLPPGSPGCTNAHGSGHSCHVRLKQRGMAMFGVTSRGRLGGL